MIMENFARFAEAIYKRANDLSGGWLGILRSAVGSLGKTRAAQAAAAIAYYSVFRFFHTCWS
jgi:hypothetical protein